VTGDGPLRADLQGLIDELGIGREVKLTGWKAHDEVIDLMRGSHILIAPSITTADGDQEGIPNVLKEAMALGMPVIGTTHSGIPELIEHGLNGFLVPEKNAEALADCLTYVIDNPDIWPSLGHNGRKYVEGQFDINTLNDHLVEIYRQLLAGSSVCSTLE
jgi:colanic acid/amylovoran biosynthesis glycosyltransferase